MESLSRTARDTTASQVDQTIVSSSTDGHNVDRIRLGATCAAETTTFLVWAPHASQVEVHLVGEATDRLLPMRPLERGYYGVAAPDVHPGQQYFYRLNGAIERPDPASYFQPHGVHAASQVVDRSFPWTDAQWRGPRLEDYVIYELHVGTFTPGGKFQDVIEQLDELQCRHSGLPCLCQRTQSTFTRWANRE